MGAETTIFEHADILPLLFGRDFPGVVMEADPMKHRPLPLCPFSSAERDGEVMIGHRAYPDGPMQEVEAMLDAIILDAQGR